MHIARELAAMGEEIHVLTAAWGELKAEEDDNGVRVHRIKALRQRPDRCSIPEMAAFAVAAGAHVGTFARDHRIDATLAFFTIPTAPAAWWMKRQHNVPYAVSLQGGDVPGFTPAQLSFWHTLTGQAITRLWRDAGAVVANSEGLATLARAHAPGIEIGVIPAGVPVDTGTTKIDYEVRDGVFDFLFVGRLVPQKGIDVLLEALNLLSRDIPWKLTLAGDGPQWTAIAGQAARLGVADRIRFLGWCGKEQLQTIYRSADIFVLPSRDEGMSNALLEAMASGLPVVCTDVAGMRDVIAPGENGMIVPQEDPKALSEALLALIEDAGKRETLGRAGRIQVVRQFSWTRAARSWRTILHKLAAQKTAK